MKKRFYVNIFLLSILLAFFQFVSSLTRVLFLQNIPELSGSIFGKSNFNFNKLPNRLRAFEGSVNSPPPFFGHNLYDKNKI